MDESKLNGVQKVESEGISSAKKTSKPKKKIDPITILMIAGGLAVAWFVGTEVLSDPQQIAMNQSAEQQSADAAAIQADISSAKKSNQSTPKFGNAEFGSSVDDKRFDKKDESLDTKGASNNPLKKPSVHKKADKAASSRLNGSADAKLNQILMSLDLQKGMYNKLLVDNEILQARIGGLRREIDKLKVSMRQKRRKVSSRKVKKYLKPKPVISKPHHYSKEKSSRPSVRAVTSAQKPKLPVYHLDGIVDGRAWVRGMGSAVLRGDIIKGYGKVLSITSMQGIMTENGLVRVVIDN